MSYLTLNILFAKFFFKCFVRVIFPCILRNSHYIRNIYLLKISIPLCIFRFFLVCTNVWIEEVAIFSWAATYDGILLYENFSIFFSWIALICWWVFRNFIFKKMLEEGLLYSDMIAFVFVIIRCSILFFKRMQKDYCCEKSTVYFLADNKWRN